MKSDFSKKLEEKVKKTIEKYKMFNKKEKLLIALSGGKDSAALAYIMKKLGYEFECLHINVGIGQFSEFSEKYAKIQSRMLGCNLNILRVKELLGKSVNEISKARPVCSVCGITRRYLMNYFAFKKGFDVLITGHNLDDIAKFYFHNLFNGQITYLSSLRPVIPKEKKLVKKVKPLFFVREEETLKYVSLNSIEFNPIRCPYERFAKTKRYDTILNSIDLINKRFLHSFVRNLSNLIHPKEAEMKTCKVCGMPSNRDVCSFCKIWNRKEPLVI